MARGGVDRHRKREESDPNSQQDLASAGSRSVCGVQNTLRASTPFCSAKDDEQSKACSTRPNDTVGLHAKPYLPYRHDGGAIVWMLGTVITQVGAHAKLKPAGTILPYFPPLDK